MILRRLAEELRASAGELKRVRSLVTIAMLLALQIILGAMTLKIDASIQITFDYLPLCVTAMFFGPVPAMLSGAIGSTISTEATEGNTLLQGGLP